jgi:hypothetical protein
VRRNPDCNRVDLDDEGDEEEIDTSECVNSFGIGDEEETDDED